MPSHPHQDVAYQRRDPVNSELHRVVRENLEEFLLLARRGDPNGRGLPRYVEQEFRKFLLCGDLRAGFARAFCRTCHRDFVVALSCKGRGMCPSCTTRRMCEVSAVLVDNTLPQVAMRQFVLTLPYELRLPVARDARLLTSVLRMFAQEVMALLGAGARRLGHEKPQCGAVTFVQRANSKLGLMPHFHLCALDGAFVVNDEGVPTFLPTPPPTRDELARICAAVSARVTAFLERRSGELPSLGAPL